MTIFYSLKTFQTFIDLFKLCIYYEIHFKILNAHPSSVIRTKKLLRDSNAYCYFSTLCQTYYCYFYSPEDPTPRVAKDHLSL